MQMITTNEVIREIEAGRKQTLLCAWRPIDIGELLRLVADCGEARILDVVVREQARLPGNSMVLRIVPMMSQAWVLGDAQMEFRVPPPLIP